MSRCNVTEADPIEIECVLEIKGRKIVDLEKNLTHNHEPSTDISGHPSFHRLSPNDVQSVKNMTLSGIPPRQILSFLRQQNPNLPAVSRTIYNLKAKIRKQNLGNRSTREDEDSYIWALSVFKKTLENHEPSVIMSDRELALMNAINMVFPNTTNLLYIWHIEKNVLAYCKKHFAHGEEFDLFMSNWNNTKKVAIEYIKNTWLPWKEKFVSAWTEKYLHFGNRSSSRAEGAHAKLKQYLQVSTGGFQDVTEKICLAIKHEFNEIKVQLASEKIQVLRTMTPCTGHFMAIMGLPCAHKIKHLQGMTIPLDLIHPHWKIDTLRLNLEDDSHNDDMKEFDELINELSSRYKMWPLSKKEFATSMITKLLSESNTFFEPTIRQPKGRPPKSKKKRGMTSTTREPSRFEHVESSQTQQTSSSTRVFQRNSGVYDNVGHISHENNLLDLYSHPTFSSDDMPYE
ncbi:uncharacterized protein LOC111894016 [Lactuca sativa]|uniref:uncharacterized protein LOC111894016 n=1 Tax=Lactuca sativa TaxID=4236 RepID=UPI000CD827D1|nr:uncharacterized protein LOC111894016 [Lactuca sativa]